MDAWEFLLQKAGDQDWLPLDMPSGEILEGQYRVMARSVETATPVIVHVSHQSEQDGVPKRWVQQRSQSIDHQGVIDVLPFTYLEPGLWQLTCQGVEPVDAAAQAANPGDLGAGQCWRKTVKLRVLALETTDIAEWEPIEPPTLYLDRLSSASPEVLDRLPTLEWSSLDQLLDTQFQDLEQLALPDADPVPVGMSAGEAARTTSDGQPRRRIIDLPMIPTEVEPLHLRVSQGASLPPKLFQTLSWSRREPQLPVLPDRSSVASAMGTLIQEKLAAPETVTSVNAIDTAFEALNLQQRFWVNLNALALNALAQAVELHAAVDLVEDPATAALQLESMIAEQIDSVDGLTADASALTTPETKALLTAPSPVAKPLPVPELILVQDELLPHQAVLIMVRLPQPCPFVGVKVWLQDALTQEILEGPRWLVDFKHNWQLGMLEANTQIIVPEHHQLVTFTAIAVHWHTQQTSHEVMVERPVILTKPYEPELAWETDAENWDS